MARLLSECPVCGRRMVISEVTCEGCHTVVRSRFDACSFCGLSPDAARFVVAFVQARGDLHRAAQELNIGPASAARWLDDVCRELDTAVTGAVGARETAADSTPASDRAAILDLLDRGEISAEEAARRFEELARKGHSEVTGSSDEKGN